jgi:hypothetical protein
MLPQPQPCQRSRAGPRGKIRGTQHAAIGVERLFEQLLGFGILSFDLVQDRLRRLCNQRLRMPGTKNAAPIVSTFPMSRSASAKLP